MQLSGRFRWLNNQNVASDATASGLSWVYSIGHFFPLLSYVGFFFVRMSLMTFDLLGGVMYGSEDIIYSCSRGYLDYSFTR